MKKLFILLSMALVLSTTAFADASDFSISLGVPLQRIDSSVDGVRSIKSETDLTPFMISNYNVFGEKLCFGFFESMSVYTNEYMSLDFLVGPAIGANLSENFTGLADQKLPINVKCIIADCGFTSPKAILDVVYRSIVHIPSGPSLWAADLFALFCTYHFLPVFQ